MVPHSVVQNQVGVLQVPGIPSCPRGVERLLCVWGDGRGGIFLVACFHAFFEVLLLSLNVNQW